MSTILIERKDGLWDTKTRTLIPNPDTVKATRNAASRGLTTENEKLLEVLGLKTNRFVSNELCLQHLVGDVDWQGASTESKQRVEECLDSLLTALDTHILPEYSLFLRLGNYTRVNELAYIILARAYEQGYEVGPIRHVRELSRISDYHELVALDVLVLITGAQPTMSQLENLATILQMRDTQGKATICISNKQGPINNYRILCNMDANDYRYDLFYVVSLEFEKGFVVNERIATGTDYDFTQAKQAQTRLNEAIEAGTDTTEAQNEINQIFSMDFANITEQKITEAGNLFDLPKRGTTENLGTDTKV